MILYESAQTVVFLDVTTGGSGGAEGAGLSYFRMKTDKMKYLNVGCMLPGATRWGERPACTCSIARGDAALEMGVASPCDDAVWWCR